ncbi:hypothetical protein M409DRAFT_53967 [Zasmidium cellare ATCC 36951]|uniref:Uncharacterized protein n=1 Tax=Zasmidium cellare ATCC 36951 TaxID=1080233 RepID=A0A6A6CK00_ZASCE|nr:uncharacterized protein M409DRAFT_53967 [Zasmidium cellare ATCC 36951]KAF2167361.1 hypothetical protein M409DRAFT_53967 [Zasmidium cellare ATCC 36951]
MVLRSVLPVDEDSTSDNSPFRPSTFAPSTPAPIPLPTTSNSNPTAIRSSSGMRSSSLDDMGFDPASTETTTRPRSLSSPTPKLDAQRPPSSSATISLKPPIHGFDNWCGPCHVNSKVKQEKEWMPAQAPEIEKDYTHTMAPKEQETPFQGLIRSSGRRKRTLSSPLSGQFAQRDDEKKSAFSEAGTWKALRAFRQESRNYLHTTEVDRAPRYGRDTPVTIRSHEMRHDKLSKIQEREADVALREAKVPERERIMSARESKAFHLEIVRNHIQPQAKFNTKFDMARTWEQESDAVWRECMEVIRSGRRDVNKQERAQEEKEKNTEDEKSEGYEMVDKADA